PSQGLSLHTIATLAGHKVSSIQRWVMRWIQEGLRILRRGSGVRNCTPECTNRRIRKLTSRDIFLARYIQSQFRAEAGGFVSSQTIHNRLQLHVRVSATVVTLTGKHRARRLEWCHRIWNI
ncbi:hypothetical protein TNCV_5109041, partial [Trichonephila clavipes]